MICKKCGTENKEFSLFCSNCGEKLEDNHARMTRFCTNCGNELQPDALFCDKCGTATNSENKSAPKNETAQSPKRKKPIFIRILNAFIGLYSLAIPVIGILLATGKLDYAFAYETPVSIIVTIIVLTYGYFGMVVLIEGRYYAAHDYKSSFNIFTILKVIGLIVSIYVITKTAYPSNKPGTYHSHLEEYLGYDEDTLVSELGMEKNSTGSYPEVDLDNPDTRTIFMVEKGKVQQIIASDYTERVFPNSTLLGIKVGMTMEEAEKIVLDAGFNQINEGALYPIYTKDDKCILVHCDDNKVNRVIYGTADESASTYEDSYDSYEEDDYSQRINASSQTVVQNPPLENLEGIWKNPNADCYMIMSYLHNQNYIINVDWIIDNVNTSHRSLLGHINGDSIEFSGVYFQLAGGEKFNVQEIEGKLFYDGKRITWTEDDYSYFELSGTIEEEINYVLVTSDDGYVNFREGPGTDCGIIAQIPSDTYIICYGPSQNGWYNVSFSGVDGYVAESQVMTVGNPF